MYNLPFIPLPAREASEGSPAACGVDDVFRRLNAGVNANAWVTMVGRYGVGKSRILEEFASAKVRPVAPEHTLLVRMPRSLPRRKLGKDEVVSPITMLLFSLLLGALRKKARWHGEPMDNDKWRQLLAKDGTRTYGHDNFSWVMEKAELAVRQLPILAVIIDDANLDKWAIDWLHHFWRECDEAFGIVLCARQELDEEDDETFGDTLAQVPHVKDCCLDSITLEPMTRGQFEPEVYARFIAGLQARPASTVDQMALIERLWDWTKGNWKSLSTVVTVFDQHLGPDAKRPRVFGQREIDDVFARLEGVRKAW